MRKTATGKETFWLPRSKRTSDSFKIFCTKFKLCSHTRYDVKSNDGTTYQTICYRLNYAVSFICSGMLLYLFRLIFIFHRSKWFQMQRNCVRVHRFGNSFTCLHLFGCEKRIRRSKNPDSRISSSSSCSKNNIVTLKTSSHFSLRQRGNKIVKRYHAKYANEKVQIPALVVVYVVFFSRLRVFFVGLPPLRHLSLAVKSSTL